MGEVNEVYREEATRIHDKLGQEVGSIIMILTIISIIVSLIKLWQTCHAGRAIKSSLGDVTSRRRLKRVIARHLDGDVYKKHGDKLADAILERVGELEEKKLENLVSSLDAE